MNNHSIITIILGLILVVSCTEKPLTMNFASNTNLLNLAGAPEPLTKVGSYSIQVSGYEISEYRFKSGPKATTDCTVESGYSEPKSVSESLAGTAPVDGDYKLCVIGKSSKSGQWHEFTSASVVNWVLDTTAPSLSGVISDGTFVGSTTESSSLSWAAGSDSGSGVGKYQLAIGTTSGGIDVLSWTDIGNITTYQKTGLSLTSGTTYYPSIRLLDKAGNISGVITGDGWTSDTTPPNVGSLSFNDGNGSWPTTESPTITWVGASDTGSGLSHYEIAIGTAAGGTDLQNWTSVGNVITYKKTGLTLTRGQNYYASIRAVDILGNTSSIVQGDGWHVRNEMWTTNGPVNAMVEHNNKLYIGGNFTQVNEWSGSGVPVSPTTGTVAWPNASFKARVSGVVFAAISDGAGGYYIGGSFTAVGGLPRNNLARILSDGTVSTWNPNANGNVDTLAFSGTTLYVGGDFTTMNGATTRNRLASFDMTSGNLNPWNPNANGNVNTLAFSGTTLYVGGDFTTMNGATTRNRLASFDTTSGNLNPWNPNANAWVQVLAISGSTLYVGGDFTTMNGATTRNRLASFDTTSGNLNPWDPNANGNVNTLAFSGTTLYVGGWFTAMNGGTTRNYLASFDITTGNLSSWAPVVTGSKAGVTVVWSLVASGTEVYIGGIYDQVNNAITRNNLASYDLLTGDITSWDPNANDAVKALAVSGITLYVGGDFTTMNGATTRNRLASFDMTSGNLNPWNPNANGNVNTLAFSGTTLYVGGDFTTMNGATTRNYLASFDTTSGNLNPWNPNANNAVRVLVVSGTALYVGGDFTTMNGATTRNRLASFDMTSGNLNPWNPNANGWVQGLAVSGTTLYVGGGFTTMNGATSRNRLASFDTTNGSLTSWNPNVNNFVRTLSAGSNRLYVGGWFTDVNGTARNRLAAFDLSTGNLTNWIPAIEVSIMGVPEIYSILEIGETVFIGADSYSIGSGAANFAPLDFTTGQWLPGH